MEKTSCQLTKAIIIDIKHAPVLTVSRGYSSRFSSDDLGSLVTELADDGVAGVEWKP